ncbi:MAG: polyprenyl synthetase family protein [Elusimicrobiota bacterium]
MTKLSLEKIFLPIKNELKVVEKKIAAELSMVDLVSPEMKNHLLASSGKLLRPALVLFSARFSNKLNSNDSPVISVAVASELIHTATLVHDDIIDQADRRRGKESVWQRWGSEQAVLLGDFLFVKAFNILTEVNKQEITGLFSQVADSMCQGQMYQIALRYKLNTTFEEYLKVIDNKTASFTYACCKAGGLLGGLSPKEINGLVDYGQSLGRSFQITDDKLDYSGTLKQTGKTGKNDLKDGEVTLPLIHCLKALKTEEKRNLKKVLRNFWSKKVPFSQIQKFMFSTKSLEYSQQKAAEFTQQAVNSLSLFPQSACKESLVNLAEYILNRKG